MKHKLLTNRNALLIIISVLLALCLAFGVFMLPDKANAEPSDEVAGEVIVLDDIEDYRTQDNGDGTYTILGLHYPTNAEFNKGDYGDYELWDGIGDRSMAPKKTAFSSAGLRKLMGLETTDNCGLIQGEGEGVSPDEDDIQFADRVYSALFTKFKEGGAVGKEFKIVIPANVKSIENDAFLTYRWIISGSIHHYTGYVGNYGCLEYILRDTNNPELTVDRTKTIEENIELLAPALLGCTEDEWNAMDQTEKDENMELVYMVISMYSGSAMNLPALIGIEFAKDADGTRALTSMGETVFGNAALSDMLTMPAGVTADGTFNETNYPELEFEEGITSIPEQMAKDNKLLKKVVIPHTVETIGAQAFNGCTNLSDLTILASDVSVGKNAFALARDAVVRIESIKQWFSIKFASGNPLSAGSGKLFTKFEIPEGTTVEDYRNNPDFIVDENNEVWQRVKKITITEDLLQKNESGQNIIPAYILSGCDIESVEILCDVEEIGERAFGGCKSLKEIYMPSVKKIGDGAFNGTALTSVTLPKTLESLGNSGDTGSGVFAECEQLRSVTFESGAALKYIGCYTFYNCVNLGKAENGEIIPLVIPGKVTKIGLRAFYRCTSLTEVICEEGASNRNLVIADWAFIRCESLESISLPKGTTQILSSAFEYCTRLACVNLPSTVTKIGRAAFYMCGNDAGGFTLYLNNKFANASAVNDGSTGGLFGYNREMNSRTTPVTVIADSYEIYDNFNSLYSGYAQEQITNTYTVRVNYNYKDISVAAPSQYVFKHNLPEQLAFPKISDKWYADEECTTEVTSASLLAFLNGENELFTANSDNVTLYMAEEPAALLFIGATNLVYNGKAYELGTDINELLHKDSAQISGDMTVTINSYTDADGNEAATPNTVCNAGTYSIAVKYTYGSGEYTSYFDIVIARQKIDISKLEWQIVKVEDGSTFQRPIALEGARLYLYTTDAEDGRIYASLTRLNTALPEYENYTLLTITDVDSSIARYRGEEIIITIGLGANVNATAYDFEYLDGCSGWEYGAYDASVMITPKTNYELTVSNTSSFNDRGLSMVANGDGTYTMTKRWYIVQINNWLVTDIDATEENNTVYDFGGSSEFGTAPDFTVPYALFGDVDNTVFFGTASDPIRLTLYYGNNVIIGEFSRKEYGYYINESMPVGDYTLKITMDKVNYGGLDIDGFERTYIFSVTAADIGFALTSGDNGYTAYEWELNANVKEELFAKFVEELENKITLTVVEQTGYWATQEGMEYYGDYALVYNFARMNNETYHESNNNNLLSVIDGENPDTYTVYFNIIAPNHNPLTQMGNGRYEYYFTVVVFETIEAPAVIDEGLVYTGNKVLPEIAESELYEVIWTETDGYISGGEHSVSFRLYDTVHYRWADVDGNTVTVNFNVDKAENVFTVSLNMLGWSFETFDTAINNIRATARFLDSGESILFKVVKDGETTAVQGLSDFTVDENGRVSESVASALNALKVGRYTLYASVKGTDNYLPLERNISFSVAKAMNEWSDGDEDLVLPSWIVGKYNEEENGFVVNAAHGVVNIVITDIDGNEYYNSVTGVNNLNNCGVGKYLLKAWVDETEDFAALAERTFTIEVLEKVGLPWWAVLLIVVGALGVVAVVLWILHEKGVLQMLTSKIVIAMRTKVTVDATIAAVRANMVAENSKKTIAEAEKRDRIEALRKAREEGDTKSAEELAAALEEKALAAAQKAEKMQKRAEKIKKHAEKMRNNVQPTEIAEEGNSDSDTTDSNKNLE